MKQFDILSRHEDLNQSRLVEASAGTGKTHSIENIVARLLIDNDKAIQLENILIVTFTRAATEDLKTRIRDNLCNVASYCKKFLHYADYSSAPDYLVALFEKGNVAVSRAQRLLEQALIFFDKAQIFTIHGFCHRMLKEFLFEGNFPVEDRQIALSDVYALIRDFFRTLDATLVSPQQLQRLLSQCKGINHLEKKLYTLAMKGVDIVEDIALPLLQDEFYAAIAYIYKSLKLESTKIMEDFLLQAPAYKEICDNKKNPKPANIAKAKAFADLFNKETWDAIDFDVLVRDGVYLAEVFHSENRDKRKTLPLAEHLHYPTLVEALNESLVPLMTKARSTDRILVSFAARCRKLIKTYFKQEEILDFDDIIDGMQVAMNNEIFVQKIQQRFAVAIIDEFQDTDPIQWQIFKTLFLKDSTSRLFLVGDPKQSIYAFRQADIYTYLKAAEKVGVENQATLEVNYRSTSALIQALNHLFSSELIDGLMVLPRHQKIVPFSPVKSSGLIEEKPFSDNHMAVNFLVVPAEEKKSLAELEEEYLLPFIAEELIKLQRCGNIHFSDCTLLVADRFQAERTVQYLKKSGIPCLAQRNKSIVQALVFPALKELLEGVLNPKNDSLLKLALAGPLCAWNEIAIEHLNDLFMREQVTAIFIKWRKIWQSYGFARFFQLFLSHSFANIGSESIGEKILSFEGGDDFFRNLMQLVSLLSEEENHLLLTPHQLLDFFDDLEKMEFDGDGETKAISDPCTDAVVVMTMHSSKGLEFEVVFAIGGIKRGKLPDFLVPVSKEGKRAQIEVVDSEVDFRYQLYSQELEAEKLRQLYVAWTRAKQRLYIPMLEGCRSRRQEAFSPMDLYTQMIQQRASSQKKSVIEILLDNNISQEESCANVLHSSQHAIAYLRLSSASAKKFTLPNKTQDLLMPPDVPCIPFKIEVLSSFTSLLSQLHVKIDDELTKATSAPHDFNVDLKNAHTLPAGIEIGTLLHGLIENIPFKIFQQGEHKQLIDYVERTLAATPFKAWTSVIGELLINVSMALIPAEAGNFSLKNIDEWHTYREHEFLYPAATFAGMNIPPGFLKGYIDLIFCHEDKYYIIDWKSNWLGINDEAYQETFLERAMHTHGYEYQAKIYAEALRHYLAVCIDKSFDELFGGVYFYFLRGLKAGSSQGIYRVL